MLIFLMGRESMSLRLQRVLYRLGKGPRCWRSQIGDLAEIGLETRLDPSSDWAWAQARWVPSSPVFSPPPPKSMGVLRPAVREYTYTRSTGLLPRPTSGFGATRVPGSTAGHGHKTFQEMIFGDHK